MSIRFHQALGTFKFPKEIKNDIIYCQRALRTHIKIHQIIVDQYYKDKDFSTIRKGCLEEIESEIYEINCEQQYLLLRVRRIIDEFFKNLHREDISVDRLLMNDYISRQIVPLIQNKDYAVVPTLIRPRLTEQQLYATYCMGDNGGNITKSPTPPVAVVIESPQSTSESVTQPILTAKQVSLLKPISERVVKVTAIRPAKAPMPEVIIPDEETPHPQVVVKPVLPENVIRSRMNLRQALSNAKAAKSHLPAAQPVLAPVTTPVPVAVIVAPKPNKIAPEVVKKVPPPKTVSKSDPSSSEESVDVRMPSPPQLETKTQPDDYDQEMFLRIFHLFTKEQIQLMQQRRSKRKRRTVHNNEKADFHYGRIDHMLSPQAGGVAKKRKREFLLSPRANRTLKKKRSPDVDRSNSSSPDEKALCNECLKGEGVIIQCKECLGNFHEICHKDINIKVATGQCPSCARIHHNAMLQEEVDKKLNAVILTDQCRELETRMAAEKNRREKLQEANKKYKIGMNALIDIVKSIQKEETEKDN